MSNKSLAELADKYGVLYVQNRSGFAPPDSDGNKPPALTINCTFRVPGRDKPISLNIPSGKLPYEIYPKRVSLQALREGGEHLQDYIDKGLLKLIKPSTARKTLSDPAAKEESRLALNMVNSDSLMLRAAKQQRAADEGNESAPDDYIPAVQVKPSRDLANPNPLSALIAAEVAKATGAVSGHPANPRLSDHQQSITGVDSSITPKVVGIMAGYNVTNDAAKLIELKSITSQLSVRDMHFVESNSSGKTLVWIRKLLRKQRSAG